MSAEPYNDGPTPDPPYIQIRKLREAKGWTQEILAAHLKVDRSLIAQWESGKKRPTLVNLQRIHGLTKYTAPKRAEIVVTKEEINGILEVLEKAGKDQLDQALALIDYSYLRVLSTVILCATGAIQTQVNPRFIDTFFAQHEKLTEEKRLRSNDAQINVTPKSKAWSAGDNVYAKAEKPSKPALDGPESDVPPEPTNGGA